MKMFRIRIPLIIFCFFITFAAIAQVKPQKKYVDYSGNKMMRRIDFRKSKNAHLQQMAKVLLQAYCEGAITAYFPQQPDRAVHYNDFLTHFGMVTIANQQTENIDENMICPQEACLSLDPLVMNCFSICIDFAEYQRFDRNRSQYFNDIQYFQLVFSAECTLNGLDYYGPVFKFADLIKIPNRFKVVNEQNNAADYTISEIIQAGMFESIITEKGGEQIKNPEKETIEIQNKRREMEDGAWEN